MKCCDFCEALLFHGEMAANPRFEYDLCDFCAGELAVAEAMEDEEALA